MRRIEKIPVTVLVAVKNEEINIKKCLFSLSPAAKIYVLDSQSTDRTADISKKFGAEVIQFFYKGGYPKKRQWALNSLEIKTPWILLIDADEEVPEKLWSEIKAVISTENSVQAFLIKKEFYFLGRKFRHGGFSFDAVLLVRRGMGKFEHLLDEPKEAMDMEVHERFIVDGEIGKIKEPLIHNDFKNLEAYLDRHNRYSTWEAKVRNNFLKSGRYGKSTIRPNLFGNSQERRRFLKKIALRMPLEPVWWFFYHYFIRFGFLEGSRGFIASRIRAQYIFQVQAKMKEMELDRSKNKSHDFLRGFHK